jgi:hypothetical protein
MEIQEIVSYYIYEDSNTIEVSFRLSIDSEDEVRNDIINLNEAQDFGFDLIQENYDFLTEYVEDDEFDDFDDEFKTVDEDILMNFMNEYYIINPDRLPKSEYI